MGGSNYPFRARPGLTLALMALAFVLLLGGCQTPAPNTVVIENNGTNTVVTMPSNPSSITTTNPISINVTHVEAGSSDPGTGLTNSNLLTLLAVLVALSAYLASVRRGLIRKLKVKAPDQEKIIRLKEARLELAKLN
jgi:hypothetical protein